MIDAHRGAFEYDWRARFHLPLSVVGKSMSWGEAIRLAEVLAADPSSQMAAALAGWEHPVSREDITLRDLYDLQHMSKAKKRPKPYPRPWAKERRRLGAGTRLTPDELRAILDAHRGVHSTKRDSRGRLRDARGRFVKGGCR